MSGEGPKRRQLGRGLSALLGEEGDDYAELDRVRTGRSVPVEFLQPGRFQPRRRFNEAEIQSLVESVRENGILQPILVRRLADSPERFEIVAGERRWRAAQAAKLHEVPVIVKDLSDGAALEIALVENLQRQDLTPIEEAQGYQRLMNEFSNTQEGLARALGKSRSHIANTVRLLSLPEPVKEMIEDGRLSAGHGRAVLTTPDPEALAREVIARGLNVRQTETQAKTRKPGAGKRKSPPPKDADTVAVEKELSAMLGLRVSINHHGGGGALVIRYKTLEQLEDVLQRLSHTPDTAAAADAESPEGFVEDLVGDSAEEAPRGFAGDSVGDSAGNSAGDSAENPGPVVALVPDASSDAPGPAETLMSDAAADPAAGPAADTGDDPVPDIDGDPVPDAVIDTVPDTGGEPVPDVPSGTAGVGDTAAGPTVEGVTAEPPTAGPAVEAPTEAEPKDGTTEIRGNSGPA